MAYATWNTGDLSGITLSNANLTATSTTTNNGVRATLSIASGKYYWEVTATTIIAGNNESVGIGNAGASLTSALTTSALINNAAGNLYVNGSAVSGGMSWLAGGTIGIAVDATAKLIWFRTAPTGLWNNSGTANPATGTGGASFSALTGPFFPQQWINSGSGNAYTANFGASAFTGVVPSGFNAGLGTPTAFNASTISREVLVSDTATFFTSALAREVLLSQVTQVWESTLVREVLLTGNPPLSVLQYAVTISAS